MCVWWRVARSLTHSHREGPVLLGTLSAGENHVLLQDHSAAEACGIVTLQDGLQATPEARSQPIQNPHNRTFTHTQNADTTECC